MVDSFRKLLSSRTAGGRRRRQILKYLLEHGDATKYRLSKELYGDGTKFQGLISRHCGYLQEVGIVDISSQGRKKILSVTNRGKIICTNMGLKSSASLGDKFLAELGNITDQLTEEEIEEGQEILTDSFVYVCLSIVKRLIDRDKLQMNKAGLESIFVADLKESKRNRYLSAVYLAAFAYSGEKSLLSEFGNESRNASDFNIKVTSFQKSTMDSGLLFPTLKAAKENGLEKNFDDLVKWFVKISPKVCLGYFPFFLSVTSNLDLLKYRMMEQSLLSEREENNLKGQLPSMIPLSLLP